MLELTNAERRKHGAPPVRLGDNPSPQIHSEQSLTNCYRGHWDLWGLKPLYRYALMGGDQYAAENASGIAYCSTASDNYRLITPALWEERVRETVRQWIKSPGHHRTLIDPLHTVMHPGIAIGEYFTNMVQVFSGDYIEWTDKPSIKSAMLTAAGRLRNACWPDDNEYAVVTLAYHPPTHRLTLGQLAGTYALESDVQVGRLLRPLPQGWYYTDSETGRQYTDYTTYTVFNKQSINPYELPADRPEPTSASDAIAQHNAAKTQSHETSEVGVAYSIVAERLDITEGVLGCAKSEFDIRVDLSPLLDHYGPGIYTLHIWATTHGKPRLMAQYPMWWQTQPTQGHPY